MPEATIDGGITVTYTFTRTLSRSAHTESYKTYTQRTAPGDIAYTVRNDDWRGSDRILWIAGKTIAFHATLTVAGPAQARGEWQAGLLQSIVRSERNGHYQDGTSRLFKLNTAYGPLSDTRFSDEPGKAPFYGDPRPLSAAAVILEEDDSPNFEVPLLRGASRLARTSGEDVFSTYLALTRERDKSVVVLSRVDWRIDWGGTVAYDLAGNPVWTPTDGSRFLLTEGPVNTVAEYMNLRATHQPTPFSLRTKEAEAFALIRTANGWEKCGLKGDTDKAQPAHLRTWPNH